MQLLAEGNIDELVNLYSDDAYIARFLGLIQGKAAIRSYLVGYLSTFKSFKMLSTDQFQETDDSIMYEATVETARGVIQIYDVLWIKDAKIWRQFPGLHGYWGAQGE